MEDTDVQAIVKQAVQEFLQEQQAKSEPAYKTELVEERKRREQLERRLNEVEEESKRSRRGRAGGKRFGHPGGAAAAGGCEGGPGIPRGA